MPTLNCLNCGNPFVAKRASARFDSDACKKAYARNNKKPTKTTVEGAGVTVGSPKDFRKAILSVNADEAISDRMKEKAAMIKRMNARLAAKGLPLLDAEPEVPRFIPTGVEAIDGITQEMDPEGFGGIPRKHVTEIFGPSGSGKTSIMKMLVNNTQDLKVLYIDAESGLTNPPEHITVVHLSQLESVEDMVIESLKAHEFDLIIIDSVAVLTSEKEIEGDKEGMGAKPKAMAQFGRRVNAAIKPLAPDGYLDKNAHTAVVFINQLRDTMNSFGVKEYTPGGRTIEYTASLRLELRSASAEKIKKDNKMIGQKIRVTVKKSRFGNIGETFTAKLMYKDLK